MARTYLLILFAIFGALSAYWAVVSYEHWYYLSALVAAVFAVFGFGMVAFIAIVASQNVTPRVAVDASGTTFRPDRWVNGAHVAATLGAFVGMSLFAIFAPLDMLNIPVPPGTRLFLVIGCVVGVIAGLPSLKQIVTKRGLNTIRLTADGYELSGVYTTVVRKRAAVSAVSDTPLGDKRPLNTGTAYLVVGGGHADILTSDWYTPHGEALRGLVRHYWRHPDRRTELAGGRAAERLANGDFGPARKVQGQGH